MESTKISSGLKKNELENLRSDLKKLSFKALQNNIINKPLYYYLTLDIASPKSRADKLKAFNSWIDNLIRQPLERKATKTDTKNVLKTVVKTRDEEQKKIIADGKVEDKYIVAKFNVKTRFPQPKGRPDIFYNEIILNKMVIRTSNKNMRKDLETYLSDYYQDRSPEEADTIQPRQQYDSLIDSSSMSKSDFNKSEVMDNNGLILSSVAMRSASPIKYSFMEHVDKTSFEMTNGFCVPDALRLRYSKYQYYDLSNEKLEEEFNEIYNSSIINKDREEHESDNDDDDVHMFIKRASRPFKKFYLSNGINSLMLKKWCILKNISMYGLDIDSQVFIKHVAKNTKLSALVYYCLNSHMYIITDENYIKHISSIEREDNDVIMTNIFREIEEGDNYNEVEFLENIPVEELKKYKEKHIIYNVNMLNDLFYDYYKLYKSIPNVKQMKNHNIISMVDDNKNVLLADHNKNDIQKIDYKTIIELCKKIKIPFRNQTISSIISEYEKICFEEPRIKITPALYIEIVSKQEMKCNKCNKEDKKKLQIDHIKPLASGGSNDISNLQALCASCHKIKTQEEKENGEYIKIDNTKSSFNNTVNEIYKSDLMKRWAFIEYVNDNVETGKIRYYDMNKTRKNLVCHSQYQLPVFSVLDDVEEFDGEIKTGIYFVETDNYFPLRGNRWYSHACVLECIKLNIIDLSNIKYQVVASFNVAPHYFSSFIDKVYKNFGDLSKIAVNSWIGCFMKQSVEKNNVRFSPSFDDASYFFTKYPNSHVSYNDLYEISFKQNIEYEEVRTPFYHQIVDLEAVELYKLEQEIIKYNGKIIYRNTDCIKAIFDDNNEFPYKNYFWDEEKTTPKYKLEDNKDDKSIIERMAGETSTEKYEYQPKKWNNVNEWNMNSILINGRAGTGKSYTVNRIIKYLKESDIKFVAVAPTNKASHIIGGQTIHKYFASYFNNKKSLYDRMKDVKYIIIDEISMVKEIYYKAFISIKRMFPDLKFIIAGDFEQLLPVNDRYIKGNYEKSEALKELCDFNLLHLTECKRANTELFNICLNVNKVKKGDFNNIETNKCLSFTNEKRMEINTKCMNEFLRKKKKSGVEFKKLEHDKNSQDVSIYSGMPIIARITNKEFDVMNNETFTIKQINKKSKQILVSSFDKELIIPYDEFQRLFYIAFCITVHKSQGETYNEPYTIYEWGKFDNRMKYVALSRAADKNYINIYY